MNFNHIKRQLAVVAVAILMAGVPTLVVAQEDPAGDLQGMADDPTFIADGTGCASAPDALGGDQPQAILQGLVCDAAALYGGHAPDGYLHQYAVMQNPVLDPGFNGDIQVQSTVDEAPLGWKADGGAEITNGGASVGHGGYVYQFLWSHSEALEDQGTEVHREGGTAYRGFDSVGLDVTIPEGSPASGALVVVQFRDNLREDAPAYRFYWDASEGRFTGTIGGDGYLGWTDSGNSPPAAATPALPLSKDPTLSDQQYFQKLSLNGITIAGRGGEVIVDDVVLDGVEYVFGGHESVPTAIDLDGESTYTGEATDPLPGPDGTINSLNNANFHDGYAAVIVPFNAPTPDYGDASQSTMDVWVGAVRYTPSGPEFVAQDEYYNTPDDGAVDKGESSAFRLTAGETTYGSTSNGVAIGDNGASALLGEGDYGAAYALAYSHMLPDADTAFGWVFEGIPVADLVMPGVAASINIDIDDAYYGPGVDDVCCSENALNVWGFFNEEKLNTPWLTAGDQNDLVPTPFPGASTAALTGAGAALVAAELVQSYSEKRFDLNDGFVHDIRLNDFVHQGDVNVDRSTLVPTEDADGQPVYKVTFQLLGGTKADGNVAPLQLTGDNFANLRLKTYTTSSPAEFQDNLGELPGVPDGTDPAAYQAFLQELPIAALNAAGTSYVGDYAPTFSEDGLTATFEIPVGDITVPADYGVLLATHLDYDAHEYGVDAGDRLYGGGEDNWSATTGYYSAIKTALVDIGNTAGWSTLSNGGQEESPDELDDLNWRSFADLYDGAATPAAAVPLVDGVGMDQYRYLYVETPDVYQHPCTGDIDPDNGLCMAEAGAEFMTNELQSQNGFADDNPGYIKPTNAVMKWRFNAFDNYGNLQNAGVDVVKVYIAPEPVVGPEPLGDQGIVTSESTVVHVGDAKWQSGANTAGSEGAYVLNLEYATLQAAIDAAEDNLGVDFSADEAQTDGDDQREVEFYVYAYAKLDDAAHPQATEGKSGGYSFGKVAAQYAGAYALANAENNAASRLIYEFQDLILNAGGDTVIEDTVDPLAKFNQGIEFTGEIPRDSTFDITVSDDTSDGITASVLDAQVTLDADDLATWTIADVIEVDPTGASHLDESTFTVTATSTRMVDKGNGPEPEFTLSDDFLVSVFIDADGDGFTDANDNCPAIANADQADTDGDDLGDACDGDIDGDGVLNGADAFPTDKHNWSDDDEDGAPDQTGDNCVGVSNPAQLDADSDGIGDACDADDDGDGVLDGPDNCQFVKNVNQADADGDGEGNVCDADDDGDGFDEGMLGSAPDVCNEGYDDSVTTVNPDHLDTGFSKGVGSTTYNREAASYELEPNNADTDLDGTVNCLDDIDDRVITFSVTTYQQSTARDTEGSSNAPHSDSVLPVQTYAVNCDGAYLNSWSVGSVVEMEVQYADGTPGDELSPPTVEVGVVDQCSFSADAYITHLASGDVLEVPGLGSHFDWYCNQSGSDPISVADSTDEMRTLFSPYGSAYGRGQAIWDDVWEGELDGGREWVGAHPGAVTISSVADIQSPQDEVVTRSDAYNIFKVNRDDPVLGNEAVKSVTDQINDGLSQRPTPVFLLGDRYDSDGDGYANINEIEAQSSPVNPDSTPYTDDDHDGIPNYKDGRNQFGSSNGGCLSDGSAECMTNGDSGEFLLWEYLMDIQHWLGQDLFLEDGTADLSIEKRYDGTTFLGYEIELRGGHINEAQTREAYLCIREPMSWGCGDPTDEDTPAGVLLFAHDDQPGNSISNGNVHFFVDKAAVADLNGVFQVHINTDGDENGQSSGELPYDNRANTLYMFGDPDADNAATLVGNTAGLLVPA